MKSMIGPLLAGITCGTTTYLLGPMETKHVVILTVALTISFVIGYIDGLAANLRS